ncbi:MAG: hypothetical protein AB7D36_02905 [Oscillospiraceae bacterium]
MNIKHDTRFFLGANSKDGFYSLYDKFIDLPGGDFLWLIKGGPGCGKSSFMHRIGAAAHAAGMDVQYIQCPDDPDSLDGLYIPDKKLGYLDATSPHAMDCSLPVAGDLYLNLGAFYRLGKLRKAADKLSEMNKRYKEIYHRVYALIAAADSVDPGNVPGLVTDGDREVARRRALGVVEREFGRLRHSGLGKESHRFISAISCSGCIRLYDTVRALCPRVYALDNEYGLADIYLRTLAEGARLRAIDTIVCHDPLHPERLEALLLPELSLGFVATKSVFEAFPNPIRNVRLDAIIEKSRVQAQRKKIRAAARLRDNLLEEAVGYLNEAKMLHDNINAIYNPHVDFDGLYALADEHIKSLLLK